ncbi:uncharacterized protein METZ01_LOCUS121998, partial [marine metagenome]
DRGGHRHLLPSGRIRWDPRRHSTSGRLRGADRLHVDTRLPGGPPVEHVCLSGCHVDGPSPGFHRSRRHTRGTTPPGPSNYRSKPQYMDRAMDRSGSPL